MATRLTRLLRREVVSIAEGRRLGPPARILIDPDRHQIAAVVLGSHSVPELSIYFRPAAVVTFDSDTIAIEALTSLRLAANDEYVLGLLGQRRIRDRVAFSSKGQELGQITDAVFDDRGSIVEYWIRRRRFGFLRPRLKVDPQTLSAPSGQLAVVEHAALLDVATTDSEPPPPAEQ